MTLKRTTLKTLGALLFTACVGSSAFAAPPEGMVAINYSRCDGNYDSWGKLVRVENFVGIDGFGECGPGEKVAAHFGLSIEGLIAHFQG